MKLYMFMVIILIIKIVNKSFNQRDTEHIKDLYIRTESLEGKIDDFKFDILNIKNQCPFEKVHIDDKHINIIEVTSRLAQSLIETKEELRKTKKILNSFILEVLEEKSFSNLNPKIFFQNENDFKKSIQLLKLIIGTGSDINEQDRDGNTILHNNPCNMNLVKFITSDDKFNINLLNKKRETILMSLIKNKNCENVKQFTEIYIKAGIDTQIINNDGKTVIELVKGNEELIDIIGRN